MGDNIAVLVLRLEGALQSWGDDSKWDFRDTSAMPTKSGIVGMIACGMGLERNDPEIVDLANDMKMAVRADRPGEKMIDFQTVTGDPLMAATGKPKTTGNTILTPRGYLQDACFTVFIKTSDKWRDIIVKALQNPKWCIYLGRKCCAPSSPIFKEITTDYPDLLEAVTRYPFANRHRLPAPFEIEEDTDSAINYYRSDAPSGINRQFQMRKVWSGLVDVEGNHVSD